MRSLTRHARSQQKTVVAVKNLHDIRAPRWRPRIEHKIYALAEAPLTDLRLRQQQPRAARSQAAWLWRGQVQWLRRQARARRDHAGLRGTGARGGVGPARRADRVDAPRRAHVQHAGRRYGQRRRRNRLTPRDSCLLVPFCRCRGRGARVVGRDGAIVVAMRRGLPSSLHRASLPLPTRIVIGAPPRRRCLWRRCGRTTSTGYPACSRATTS